MVTGRKISCMDLIDAHIAHIRAAGAAEATVVARKQLLKRLDRELPMGLERATVEELEHWLACEGWTRGTRATYWAHVRAFFRWAANPARPVLDYDPSASLSRPRVPLGVPHPCTDAQLVQAITQARPPWRRLIILAAYAGLRCCELATVTRNDINEHVLIVRGKGDKERVIPTYPYVWAEVSDLAPGELIAGGRTAEKITKNGNRHLRRIGLPGITMHDFRHWFATNCLAQGADLRVVQELLGHASPATTAVYTQITSRQRQIAVAALPALAPTSA